MVVVIVVVGDVVVALDRTRGVGRFRFRTALLLVPCGLPRAFRVVVAMDVGLRDRVAEDTLPTVHHVRAPAAAISIRLAPPLVSFLMTFAVMAAVIALGVRVQNATVVADVVVARFTGRLAVVACRRVVIGHTEDDRMLHGTVVDAGSVAYIMTRATLPVVIVVRAGAIGAVLGGEEKVRESEAGMARRATS